MLRIWVDRNDIFCYVIYISYMQQNVEEENEMNSNRLKAKMKEEGYTQLKLCRELGVSIQTINSKINNHTQFTLNEVVKLMSILSIDEPSKIFFN